MTVEIYKTNNFLEVDRKTEGIMKIIKIIIIKNNNNNNIYINNSKEGIGNNFFLNIYKYFYSYHRNQTDYQQVPDNETYNKRE